MITSKKACLVLWSLNFCCPKWRHGDVRWVQNLWKAAYVCIERFGWKKKQHVTMWKEKVFMATFTSKLVRRAVQIRRLLGHCESQCSSNGLHSTPIQFHTKSVFFPPSIYFLLLVVLFTWKPMKGSRWRKAIEVPRHSHFMAKQRAKHQTVCNPFHTVIEDSQRTS